MGQWVGRTAVDIAAAVRDRVVTATDVAIEHLEHLAASEPRLGAFEVVLREQALADARALDARTDLADLQLAGVPVGIKDVVDVAGAATRKGSVAVPDTPATEDGLLVARLRAAGAVIVGKTRCPELCFAGTSDNGSGVALNPWDLSRTAGGSSGGSAAALAAGVVPLALGSDGGGSIRLPSAACGVFGIKPGGDTVDRGEGEPAANWYGMSSYGPMGTTVADVALMLAVLTSRDEFAKVSTPPSGLRLGTAGRGSLPVPVDKEIRRGWQAALAVLASAGHTIVDEGPTYPRWLSPAIARRSFQGAVFDADRLGMDVSKAGRRTQQVLKRGRRMVAKGAPDPAHAERWKQMADEYFARHDALITPATGMPAFRQRDFHNGSFTRGLWSSARFGTFTSPWNLAELPAATVPVGVTVGGLPHSVQIVAGRGREDLVLSLAAVLEAAMPWPRQAPGWA